MEPSQKKLKILIETQHKHTNKKGLGYNKTKNKHIKKQKNFT